METEYNNYADTYENNNEKYDNLIYNEHKKRKVISDKQRQHLERIRDLKKVKNIMRRISKQHENDKSTSYLSSLFIPCVALVSIAGIAYGVGLPKTTPKRQFKHVNMFTEDKGTQYEPQQS